MHRSRILWCLQKVPRPVVQDESRGTVQRFSGKRHAPAREEVILPAPPSVSSTSVLSLDMSYGVLCNSSRNYQRVTMNESLTSVVWEFGILGGTRRQGIICGNHRDSTGGLSYARRAFINDRAPHSLALTEARIERSFSLIGRYGRKV